VFGPFSPPSWFYDENQEEGATYIDGVTLAILSGMARPGDDDAAIRKNIATARAYAEEVEKQWKASVEEDRKARRIKDIENRISDVIVRLENAKARLVEAEAALAEQDRIISSIVVGEKPKTKRGQELIGERQHMACAVEEKKTNIKQYEAELQELKELKGMLDKTPESTGPDAAGQTPADYKETP
jgi:chaperonin cofactor prefoldin